MKPFTPEPADTTDNPYLREVLPGAWRTCAMRFWWINTFTIDRANFYRFRLSGWNDFAQETRDMGRTGGLGPEYHWSVPTLGGRYAFRLRDIS